MRKFYSQCDVKAQIPSPKNSFSNPQHKTVNFNYGEVFWILYINILYSTLLHLPPLRFHCVGGCWDRSSQDCCCDFGIGVRRSNHARLDLVH